MGKPKGLFGLFRKDVLLSTEFSLRAATAEFLSTMFFIAFATGTAASLSYASSASPALGGVPAPGTNVTPNIVGIAAAFGFSLAALLYASGHTSGGQLNPAVVLGFLFTGRMPILQAFANIVSQVLGAIVGAAIVLGLLRGAANGSDAAIGQNSVPSDVSSGGAFLGETIATFALVFVVLEVVANPQSVSKSSAPLAIGFIVFAAHLWLIPFTTVGINPARSLGPAIVTGDFGRAFWVFMAGPVVGALLGAIVHTYFASEVDTTSKDEPKPGSNDGKDGEGVQDNGNRQDGPSGRPADMGGNHQTVLLGDGLSGDAYARVPHTAYNV